MGDMSSPPIPPSKTSEYQPKAIISSGQPSSTQKSVEKAEHATRQSLPTQQTSAVAKPGDTNTSSPAEERGSFNMTPMTGALPRGGYQHLPLPGGHRQYNQQTSPPAMQHMLHNHFAGPHHGSMMVPGFYVHQPHLHQYYAADAGQQPMQERGNVGYYPMQFVMNHQQLLGYYQQPPQFPDQNHPRPEYMMNRQEHAQPHGQPQARRPPNRTNRPYREQSTPSVDTSRQQNPVRGPPRKPHQSGFAVWIGNLPPQTDLMTLVRHVCELAPGLQSVFLISKSNCAFANFKEETTSMEAQKALHDSKFQSVRLVCRLRKTIPDGASDNQIVIAAGTSNPASPTIPGLEFEASSSSRLDRSSSAQIEASENSSDRRGSNSNDHRDRFFVLKSLTREYLELSVRTGVWATQSHNEELLNNAFKTTENVYLIFSANKSGEYFGFARMTSEINQDPDAAIQFASHNPIADESETPKAATIEAKDNTPKGRIIDDSARGTMFWEIEGDEVEGGFDEESESASIKDAEEVDEDMQTWGKPFNLEWLSTVRLPFYRTRGLRNPWNSNREIKIARDGTELEPSVARRLIGLLNHNSNAVAAARLMNDPRGITQIR